MPRVFPPKHARLLDLRAKRILICTSFLLVVSGLILIDVGQTWSKNVPDSSLRNTSVKISSHEVQQDTLQIAYGKDFKLLGLSSMGIGVLSCLNYMSYTGHPGIIALIDALFCIFGGCLYVLKSLQWLLKGNLAMIGCLTWAAGTVLIYALRTLPEHQVGVHAAALGGLLCWAVISMAHIQGYSLVFFS